MGMAIGYIEIGGSKPGVEACRSDFLAYLIQALLPEGGESGSRGIICI